MRPAFVDDVVSLPGQARRLSRGPRVGHDLGQTGRAFGTDCGIVNRARVVDVDPLRQQSVPARGAVHRRLPLASRPIGADNPNRDARLLPGRVGDEEVRRPNVVVAAVIREGLSADQTVVDGQSFIEQLDPFRATFVNLERCPSLTEGAEPDCELHPAIAESVKGGRP